MTNKEEEEKQLLQDASTLLMFANVAAKQQTQHPPIPQQQQHMVSPPTQQQPAPPPRRPSLPSTSPHFISATHHLDVSLNKGTPTTTNQFQQPQYPYIVPYGAPISALPTQAATQPTVQIPEHIKIHPQPMPTQHTHRPTPASLPSNQVSQTNINQQIRQSSISSLMNPTQSQSLPQEIKPQPKPFVSKQLTPPGNLSTPIKSESPASNLPKQGNFTPTHERSRSTPDVHSNKHRNIRASPNPSQFIRGIDLETGERDSNNARIAAAALTAAADIPLPLKHVEHKQQAPPPQQQQQQTTAQPLLVTEKTTVVKFDLGKPKKEKDEDQLTEPENDDRTDDEKTEDEAVKKPKETKPPRRRTPPLPKQRQQQQQPKFIAPPLSSYQVDPDSGLIGCICGIDDDDGFTIQCDVCYRWQHCLCMGFQSNEEVPEDEYKCYYCDASKWGKFDPDECRRDTMSRLEGERPVGGPDAVAQQKAIIAAREMQKAQQDQQQQIEQQAPVIPPNKRKQSNSDKADIKKRKVEEKKESGSNSPAAELIPQELQHHYKDEAIPNKDNELLEDGVTAEAYQSVYYKLTSNDYKRQAVRQFVSNAGEEFYQSFQKLPKPDQQKRSFKDVEIMTLNQFKSTKMSKIHLPNHQKYLQEQHKLSRRKNHNKTIIQVRPYSENQKQKFNGISRLSLFISSLNSDSLTIPENTPVIEYLGEIDMFSSYCCDRVNQYPLWGTTKPKVLKTSIPNGDDKVDVVLDSRFVGNESRFIRKACPIAANCRIQPIYIPEKNMFRFIVVTSKPITLKAESHDEELRLPWEWDPLHPILKLYENKSTEKFENLTNLEKSALITYVDNILHFAECGCSTSSYSTCAIFKIKKATSYLLRSTRKASSISNVNLTKSKEDLIMPRPNKEYISWDERMIKRDEELQEKLLGSTEIMTEVLENGKDEEDIHNDKPAILFKMPFKKQLISRVYVESFPQQQVDTREIEVRKEELTEISNEVPIPVVPELVISIDRTIDEKLKPKVKEVEAKVEQVLIKSDLKLDKENEFSGDGNIPKIIEAVVSPTVASIVEKKDDDASAKAATAATSPKVVKKLSFADYKKKMM
ncbi:SET3 [[Candida] subhashii]|uniref:SET3 n=1 Tax=[Candida] subhashii TaxID=561895 RepID=A0A8J5UKN4_9ASCO|nr:SET3 [[Candida] subhashii]KAG7662161.1 SET3 [[Candida] subhashii]